MKLINNTKNTSKIGFAVIVDPKDPQSFVYAPADSTNVLGVIAESKPYRELCEIATSGVAQVYVSGNTQKGSIIRSRKSNETVSAGACKVVSSSDTSYMKIGTALESSNGLVRCQLGLANVASSTGSGSITSVEYLSLVNRVSTNSAAGAGGSITSTEYTSLVNRVSNEISDRASVSAVLDAKISALSAIVVSGIASVDNRATSIEAKVSVLSAIVVSGIGSVDGRATSLDNAISIVSNALSAVEVRVSSHSATLVNVSAHNATTSVKGLQSALNIIVDRVSANSAAGGGGSVTSNEVSAIESRVNVLSDGLSNEISNRTSADGVLANTISVLSTTLSPQYYFPTGISVTAGTLVSGGFSALSTFGGEAVLVSEVVSTSPLTMTIQLSAVSQAPNRLQVRAFYEGNAAHSVDVAIFNHTTSVWDSYGKIPSDTALRYYEFNIYTGAQHVSTNNARVRFVHNTGGTNTHSFQLDYLALAKLIEGAGITNHGALQGLADDDHLQYALADGTRGFSALSDVVSALSARVVSGLASLETLRSTLSAIVVSGIASVDARVTSVAGLIPAVSVTSQEVSAQAVSIANVVSNNASLANVSLSAVLKTDAVSADNVVSNNASLANVSLSAVVRADYMSAIGVLSNLASNWVSDVRNASTGGSIAAISLMSDTKSAVANVSAVSGAGSATGLQNVVQCLSARITSVAALAGGGSVTSDEVSAVSQNASANNASLSAVLATSIQVASAAATSVGALLSAHNIQIALVQTMQSIATVRASPMGAGMTVSGLSVTFSASCLYTMDAMIMYSVTSAAQPFAVGMIFPAVVNCGGKVETRIAVVSSDTVGTQSTVNTRIGWWDNACTASMLISATGLVTPTPVTFNGMFLTSNAGGTLHLMAAASSGASGGIHIMKGSYLRVFKIKDYTV
jgi:hypothetical protein